MGSGSVGSGWEGTEKEDDGRTEGQRTAAESLRPTNLAGGHDRFLIRGSQV